MEAAIRLTIVSPEETVVDAQVVSVTLPGVVSPFQVLKDHAALITSLEAGTVGWVSAEGEACTLAVRSGFVRVLDNRVFVCAEL